MKTILVVDDDAFFRIQIQDALGDTDFRFIEAEDGLEAVAALETEDPDLIILDLFMPNQNGVETLPAIRQRCPGVPILVVSSLDSPELADQCLEAGAAGFVIKPLHPVELGDAVRQLLGG